MKQGSSATSSQSPTSEEDEEAQQGSASRRRRRHGDARASPHTEDQALLPDLAFPMRRANSSCSPSPSASSSSCSSASSPQQQQQQQQQQPHCLPYPQPVSTSSSRKRASPPLLLLPRLLHNADRAALSPAAAASPLSSRATTTATKKKPPSPNHHRGGGSGVRVLSLVLLLLAYALIMAAMQSQVVTREVVRSVRQSDDPIPRGSGGSSSQSRGVHLPPASTTFSSHGNAASALSPPPPPPPEHAYLLVPATASTSGRTTRGEGVLSGEGTGGVARPRAAVDPHYGGLRIRRPADDIGGYEDLSTPPGSFPWYARRIRSDDDDRYHDEKKSQLRAMAKSEKYYEDYYDHYDDLEWAKRKDGCYRPRTTYQVRPTCNAFHERSLGLADPDHPTTYLGRGYYRMSWTLGDANRNVSDVVLKQLRYRDDQDLTNTAVEEIRVEAMSLERTSWSDRTTDIYGHCSTSIVVEMGYPIEYKLIHDYYFPKDPSTIEGPQNHLTAPQKLSVLLSMAEGLALLHGNYDGVIVNDDIQLSQWLLGKDNKIKLNDFNKAVILEWSPVNQTYCDIHSGYTHQYRGPEELNRKWPVDERADVFAFGQTMYTVLTGMAPFYERGSREEAIRLNKEGGRLPYIEPRYRNRTNLIERRLAEIMVPCYQYRREDRTSIFRAVRRLRETVQMYEAKFPNEPRIADVSLRDIVEDGFG